MQDWMFVGAAYGLVLMVLVGYWLSVERRLRALAADRSSAGSERP